jgi:DNA-binding Lrp family transcriptional regulator
MPGLPKLDRIDINILVQLQKNGAISNLYLAEQVGLSPGQALAILDNALASELVSIAA